MLEALSHAHDYGAGDTRPQLFWCLQNGQRERWVLKLMGKSHGELVADWIGSLLALRLGLHCPAVAVADVSAEALATAPNDIRAWARPGPAFATRELIDTTHIMRNSDVVAAMSAEELGAMFVFDAWFDVVDRRRPDGWNLLLSADSNRAWVLDFGKGLATCLHPLLGPTPADIDPLYPPLVRAATSPEAAATMCESIEHLSYDDLHDIVTSVPAAWADHETQSRIVAFLQERTGRVRTCLG